MMQKLPFGPFTPGQAKPTFFAMWADDCLLHFDAHELTAKQQEDHEANIVLTAMLQVAQTYMGRSKDHAAMHDTFKLAPWADTLNAYNSLFKRLLGDVIPPSNYHYFPRENFYEAITQQPIPAELLSLYMVSGSNIALHNSTAGWELSKRVNSKMHFAANAPKAGLPVPNTLVCTKGTLAEVGPAFFARHPEGCMLKIQGLAGARNVTSVSTLAQAHEYIAEFGDDLSVLLQEQLDTTSWKEMTVDLDVSDNKVRITNTRQILFADGLWVGNYIHNSLELSDDQKAVCLQVGDYARAQGFSAPEGWNCGIDFFVRDDNEIIVIEINARWTGGLFPAQLIKRLGLENEHCVAFIDTIDKHALPAYLDYLHQNVSAEPQQCTTFRILPMGFSPFVQSIDGAERIYVWQVVAGDFAAFQHHKNEALGAAQLPVADLIAL